MAIPFLPNDDGESHREALLRKLAELPPKPRRNSKKATSMELVAAFYEHLKSAQERGYTYEELAELLSSEGSISITAGTLRKYMAKAKKEQESDVREPATSPAKPALPPTTPQKASSTLSPDRQARLTRRTPEPDDDIESQFSNLN
jgi:hypothetical protein